MSPTNCARCGALIDPLALACPYCQFTTPSGVTAHQQRQHEERARAAWAAQAHAHSAVAAAQRVTSLGGQAMALSIAGFAVCCLPLGLVGAVQGYRARAMAIHLGLQVPGRATAGMLLGVVATLVTAGIYVAAYVSSEEAMAANTARMQILEKKVASGAASTTLEHEVACDLAELHVRKDGWDGSAGYRAEDFDCSGKLSPVSAESMDLEAFRFRVGETKRHELHVCFDRGARWYVTKAQTEPCAR